MGARLADHCHWIYSCRADRVLNARLLFPSFLPSFWEEKLFDLDHRGISSFLEWDSSTFALPGHNSKSERERASSYQSQFLTCFHSMLPGKLARQTINRIVSMEQVHSLSAAAGKSWAMPARSLYPFHTGFFVSHEKVRTSSAMVLTTASVVCRKTEAMRLRQFSK